MATISEHNNYYLQFDEPLKGCLLALRDIILKQDESITPEWKYRMPFFCYKGKMFCYLWVDKVTRQPYIGFVEGKHLHHPQLVADKRARMKIMLFDSEKDLPVELIECLLNEALDLYRSRKIKC